MKENLLKTKITKVIACTDKKKDGTDLKDGKGNKKWRVVINVPEHNDRFLTGFLYKDPQFQVGQETEIVWWEEENEYNGQKQMQLYFKLPGKDDKLMKRIEHLENTVTKLGLAVASLEAKVFPPKVAGTNIDYPEHKGEPNFEPKVEPLDVAEDIGLDQINEEELINNF